MTDHDDIEYTRRLEKFSESWLRRAVAQLPYRIHIRMVAHGRTLDVGCGIGRNLRHLGSTATGVDTNRHSVATARADGLDAYTVEEFRSDTQWEPESFDNLLYAHVLEHMELEKTTGIVSDYLGYLRRGGRVIVIVPQEAGFKSDPTHVAPVGHAEIEAVAERNGLRIERVYSFPFPTLAGRWFRHNETVGLMRKP